MRDASGQPADRFHLLRLTKLQLQSAGFSNVFHKDLEGASGFAVRNRAAGNARHNGGTILPNALRGQVVKCFAGVKIVGGLKPLLSIGVQASQMPARELGGAVIAQHCHQRGVCVLERTEGIAAANAVRCVHHQRAKIGLRPAQAFLSGAKGGVEPADQQGHREEQREVRDRLAILSGSQFSGERIVSADGERKRGGGESRLPSSVPGAHHDRDREHHQPALCDIGEEQSRDERQNRTKESDSIAQEGIARRRYGQAADEGEFHSHDSC